MTQLGIICDDLAHLSLLVALGRERVVSRYRDRVPWRFIVAGKFERPEIFEFAHAAAVHPLQHSEMLQRDAVGLAEKFIRSMFGESQYDERPFAHPSVH